MTTQNKQTGSILIEALISLVVLGLGIVAIAKLQGSFMRSGADAQSRNVALQLAQQKVDDLRAYNQLYNEGGLSWPPAVVSPTTRPFELIVGNQGGSDLPTSPIVGNTLYSITWTVSNFNGAGAVVAPTSIGDTSYKKVNMLATWAGIDGTPSAVRLNSYIAKINVYGSKALTDVGVGGAGPQVLYTPGVAPDVIAIDTNGESTETTLPEPAIKNIANTDYFYSQFETVTYTGSDVELRGEEFLNIRCECEYDTSGDNHIGLGFPVARSIWHPSHANDVEEHAHYVASFFHPGVNDHAFIAQTESGRADFLGEMITKVVGQSAAGSSSQHPFCNICCRDHHDGDQAFLAGKNAPADSGKTDDEVTGAYACKPDTDLADAGDTDGDRSKCADPWRPEADYDSTTGDHKHYTAAGVFVEPGQSGTYLEACRLKRINGEFKVFQDWHLHGGTYVAAAQDAFTPGAVNNVVTEYRQYIKDYVGAVITHADNLPITMTTTFHNPATDYVWPPSGFIGYPTSKQFIARGIYMDYLDKFTLDRLNEVVGTASFFENAPFNEINLTRLTDWQPECVYGSGGNSGDTANTLSGFRNVNGSPTAGSCVTNFGLGTDKATTPEEIKRGLVLVNSSSDSFQLGANILLSNTGIIGINDFLQESSVTVSYPTTDDKSYDIASVTYSHQFGTPPNQVSFVLNITRPSGWNDGNSGLTVIPSGDSTLACTLTSGEIGFTCTTASGITTWTGAISVSGTKNPSTPCGPSSTGSITRTNIVTTSVTLECN